MFKLDNAFLTDLGLGSLPVAEKNKLLQAIYERLEMNVGMRLAENMTDQQLDEFEGFIDKNDEAGALRWLETNFPNYKQVVAEELDKLKQEVAQSAPQILQASQVDPLAQQAANQAQAPQAPVQPQPAMPQQPMQTPLPEQPATPVNPSPTPWQTGNAQPPAGPSEPQL